MESTERQNVIGIKIESKERYDKLMNEHSGCWWIFNIDFKGSFNGYPKDYPCLVKYCIGNNDPFGIMYAIQMKGLLDDGYLIQIFKE